MPAFGTAPRTFVHTAEVSGFYDSGVNTFTPTDLSYGGTIDPEQLHSTGIFRFIPAQLTPSVGGLFDIAGYYVDQQKNQVIAVECDVIVDLAAQNVILFFYIWDTQLQQLQKVAIDPNLINLVSMISRSTP